MPRFPSPRSSRSWQFAALLAAGLFPLVAWAQFPPGPPPAGNFPLPPPGVSPAPGAPLPASPYPVTAYPEGPAPAPPAYAPPFAAPAATPPAPGATPFAAPPGGDTALFEDAQIVAVVGDEVILAGDLMGNVNEVMAQYRGKAPEEELKKQAKVLMQKYLARQIETKLAYLDFLRTVPADRRSDLNEKIAEQYNESQLPILLKHYKVNSAAELDAKLREFGSSLRKNQRLFGERMLASQMVRRNVNPNEEVTFDEMHAYYQKNEAEYTFRAQVRWEHLMTRYDKFDSRDQAFQALAQMGNEVLRGAPLAAVARRSSQGFDADEGGYHDWTSQGSLASAVLDGSLFSLPNAQLSAILADDDGFHIVRVIERREAGKVPFEDAQPAIKERIKKERSDVQAEAYIAKLRKEIHVWTIFDSVASNPVEQR